MLIFVKRNGYNDSPDVAKLKIAGSISEITVMLTPYTYCHLINISRLFYPGVTQQLDSKGKPIDGNPMCFAKLKKKAQFSGQVKKHQKTIKYLDKYYAILASGMIFFFKKEEQEQPIVDKPNTKDGYESDSEECKKLSNEEVYRNLETLFKQKGLYFKQDEGQRIAEEWLSIKGCEKVERLSLTSLAIKNYYDQTCELYLDTEEEATRWQHAIEANAKQMANISNVIFEAPEPDVQVDPFKKEVDDKLIKSLISLSIPVVKLILSAEKAELDPNLKESDPKDCGLFSRLDSPIQKWKLEIVGKNLIINQTKTHFVTDMVVTVGGLKIAESGNKKDKRFPFLMKVEKGLTFGLKRVDRAWSGYQNEDMTVALEVLGALIVNWQPLAMNRLFRFFKFMKFKAQVTKLALHDWLLRYKSFHMLSVKEDKSNSRLQSNESAGSGQERHYTDDSQQQSQQNSREQHIQDCKAEPQMLMRVHLKVQMMKMVCIHPQNDTYPIFSVTSDDMNVDYQVFFDHQIYDIRLPTLQVTDHSNHPNTLDPLQRYTSKAKLESQLIFAKRSVNVTEDLFRVQVLTFSAPLEKTCPLARDAKMKQFDKHVKIDVASARLIMSKEYLYRCYEYFYYQLIGAVSDANPYYPLITKSDITFKDLLKEASHKLNEDLLQTEYVTHPYSNALTSHLFNDLQQSPYCTGIELNAHYPLILIKDRNYLKLGKIRLESNDITITSSIQSKAGRYRKQPLREILVNFMTIKARGVSTHYTQGKSSKTSDKLYTIIPPTDVTITRESLAYSPYLYEHQFMTAGFDFEDIDISQTYLINCSPVKIFLIQEILTYLMRCNDLNISYTDERNKDFQLGVWNDPDNQKFVRLEEETRRKYRDNQIVHNRKTIIKFPSLSMTLFSDDDEDPSPFGTMIAELVYWNFNLELTQFPDWRKNMVLSAHSLKILRLATELSPEDKRVLTGPVSFQGMQFAQQQCKATVLAHISAHNYIVTDEDFYHFNIDKLIQVPASRSSIFKKEAKTYNNLLTKTEQNNQSLKAAQQMRERRQLLEKKNFVMEIQMKADGEKIYKIKLCQPKMVMRADIFLMIFEFFTTAYPLYSKNSRDQPNNWSTDQNSARRQEILLELKQGLVVLENTQKAKQTVVCQGSVILTKTRETLNQVKLKLLDRFDKTNHKLPQKPSNSSRISEYRHTSNSKSQPPNQFKERSFSHPMPSSQHNEVDYDYSHKTRILLLSLTEFCPYFCATADLDGKQFRHVKKRELMKPFNMHFNTTQMIELKNRMEQEDFSSPNLVFQSFKKKEASLDWTFLKISFQDIKIMKQIMKHNLELIQSRIARYETLEASVASLNSSSSDEIITTDSDSDMVDSNSSDGNSSYHSLKQSHSFLNLPVHIETQKSSILIIPKPLTNSDGEEVIRDTIRMSYSQRKALRSKKIKQLSNNSSIGPEMVLSDEEKVFESGSARRKSKMQINKTRRQSRLKKSSDSSLSSNKQIGLGQYNILDTLKIIRSFQNRKRESSSNIFESKEVGEPLREKTIKVEDVENNFYFISKTASVPVRKIPQQRKYSMFEKGISLQQQYSKRDVIQEVEDEFDDTVVPSDEEDGLGENQLAHLGGKQCLQYQHTLRSIDLNHTIVIASDEDSQSQYFLDTINDDQDFGMGRVKIRAVDLDQLNHYSDKEALQVVKEEQGHDSMQVMSYGIQIMIINDNCGNFMPVLGISLSEMFYQYGFSQGMKQGKTQFSSSVSYFNSLAGCWEPAIEKFNVILQNNQEIVIQDGSEQDGKKSIVATMNKEININLTESLLKTIKDAHDSFKTANLDTDLNQDAFESTKQQKRVFTKQRSIVDFEAIESQSFARTVDETEVTPYSICNLTESSILVNKVTDLNTIKNLRSSTRRQNSLQMNKAINEQMNEEFKSDYLNSDVESQMSRGTNKDKNEVLIPVLKVHSCETKNYAVDYEDQVKQQVDQFRQSNLNLKHEELVCIQFDRKSKASIENINLNSNKMDKMWPHYFRNSKYKEFILYGVSFKNLKRVLTLRTQYLLRNDTLLDYDVKIMSCIDKERTEKVNLMQIILKSGCELPLPESYNFCAMQLRLAKDTDSSWSMEWPIYAIKKIVEVDKPGFLHHGQTYTFFRKQYAGYPDTYDLVLMPPLVIQNCLPVDFQIEFVDSNKIFQKHIIEKEEIKNIFQLNLQQKIDLRLKIEGYSSALIKLDTSKLTNQEERIRVTIHDQMIRHLELHYVLSQKTAGFKITFYVTNCLINSTDQNLLFFYEEPRETALISDRDKALMVSEPLELLANQKQAANEGIKNTKKVHMLSRCKQVYAKMEGSSAVSNEILTYAPGTRERFSLPRKNKLYEFGYATQMYLANKDEFIYTKVTTISPLFIIVNYTQSTILFAQEAAKTSPLFVKPNQQLPFHWNEKDSAKRVAVRIIPGENDKDSKVNFEWTVDFPLTEAGSLTLISREMKEVHFIHKAQQLEEKPSLFSSSKPKDTNKFTMPLCRTKRRFLRINRHQNLHQMFIIIEEEEEELPTMKIENKCESYGLLYQQVNNTNCAQVDVCDAKESQAFTWSKPEGKKELQIQLYEHSYKFASSQQDIGQKQKEKTLNKDVNSQLYQIIEREEHEFIVVSMDELNQPTQKIQLQKKVNKSIINMRSVYMTVFTNGYTKILRIDDKPPINQDGKEVIVGEETKDQVLPSQMTTFNVNIAMINVSIVETGKELITLYLEGIVAKIEKSPSAVQVVFGLESMQIDNQTETYPLYPVILKPQIAVQRADGHRPLFFVLEIHLRLDVPNVNYFERIAFRLQGVDIKLELSHIVEVTEFITRVGKIFKRNLIKQHSIFQKSEKETTEVNFDFGDSHENPFELRTTFNQQDNQRALLKSGHENYFDQLQIEQLKKKQAIMQIKNNNTRRKSMRFTRRQHVEVEEESKSPRKKSRYFANEEEDQLMFQEEATAIRRIYIKEYFGTPIDLKVTLIKHNETQSAEDNDKLSFFKTISSLGLTITTFEAAPLKINALEIKNVFGDKREVLNLFKGYYKQQLKWNMFNFIGASNLIGNPISFLNSVGTGVKDFWYEPTQGIQIGPAEFSSGLYRGTKSLVSNTMVGSLNSISKISSSLSSTLLTITGDSEYMQQRNIGMIQRRPVGVLQGIEQGVGSALNSGWSGLRGLITKPNEGFQREGASGFLKGALSGTAGLFVKPLAGAMDFVSKTSEGIQNATKSEAELRQDERIRPPRAFYRKEQIIMDYENSHANLLGIVPQLRFKLPEQPNQLLIINCQFFYNAWIIEEQNGLLDWVVLFLTHEKLCKIIRYKNATAMRDAIAQERRLRDRIVEGSLIQIVSVNALADLKSIEMHEGKVLDIEFRDGREIVMIKDMEMAQQIKQRVEGLHREQQQDSDEQTNSLLYKQNKNVMTQKNIFTKTRSSKNNH